MSALRTATPSTIAAARIMTILAAAYAPMASLLRAASCLDPVVHSAVAKTMPRDPMPQLLRTRARIQLQQRMERCQVGSDFASPRSIPSGQDLCDKPVATAEVSKKGHAANRRAHGALLSPRCPTVAGRWRPMGTFSITRAAREAVPIALNAGSGLFSSCLLCMGLT